VPPLQPQYCQHSSPAFCRSGLGGGGDETGGGGEGEVGGEGGGEGGARTRECVTCWLLPLESLVVKTMRVTRPEVSVTITPTAGALNAEASESETVDAV